MSVERRLTTAVLAACLGLPLTAQAGPRAFPAPPLPDGVELAPVAKRIVFNGLEMRASVFRSSLSADALIAFYSRAWKGRVVSNVLDDATVLGHADGGFFTTVQVRAVAGGSEGQVGVVDTDSAPKQFEPGKGLPKPLGSKVFNDILYPDDPVPARTVGLRNALSPLQNAAFYRERLAAEGWKPEPGQRCAADGCVLGYTRGDAHLTWVATPDGSGASRVVMTVQQP